MPEVIKAHPVIFIAAAIVLVIIIIAKIKASDPEAKELKATEADFTKRKRDVHGLMGLRELYHVSGLGVGCGERCDMILSADGLYLSCGGKNIELKMSQAADMVLIGREELEQALKDDPGSQFYNYLAYGEPGMLADEGFTPPKIIKKLSPKVLCIQKQYAYTSDLAGQQVEARQYQRQRMGAVRQEYDRVAYESRNKRFDHICFRVKMGSAYIASNMAAKFRELKNNRRETFRPQR